MTKSEQIKATMGATRERRKTQDCKVRELKLQYNKLNVASREALNMLFVEAKWLTNAVIASEDIFNFDSKTRVVDGLDKDKNIVRRELKYLSSQMKQGIVNRVQNNISALAKVKAKGRAVGKLKFKSKVDAIPLKQAGVTYKIVNNKLKIQGIKQGLRINGVKQLQGELANATLVHKTSGYYLKVTTFEDKFAKQAQTNGKVIGLDFGIKTQITSCDSESVVKKLNWNFAESIKQRKAQQRVSQLQKPKGTKQSNNYYAAKKVLNLFQEKLCNQKKEAINKAVHELKQYDNICFQDENIRGWKSSRRKGWGRRIQHSIMGGIIGKLKLLPTAIVINRFVPTTSYCPSCRNRLKLTLEDRTINCQCGYTEDRDTHSAKLMMLYGLGLAV